MIKYHDLNRETIMNDVITQIENVCTEFVIPFQDQLIWEWDDRFEAVLATCTTKNKEDVQQALKRHLKTIWSSSNTEEAPEVILDLISHFGGLMPGQLLFTSDPEQEMLLCSAWWPWSDGDTVSIRIAPFSKNISDEDKAQLNNKFRGWFRI
jgi:hypothetical protein